MINKICMDQVFSESQVRDDLLFTSSLSLPRSKQFEEASLDVPIQANKIKNQISMDGIICFGFASGSILGGIMKSCSYKSFCERARREGSRAPGVSVHCCYSNNCNARGLGSRNILSTSYFSLLFSAVLWHLLFNLEWNLKREEGWRGSFEVRAAPLYFN